MPVTTFEIETRTIRTEVRASKDKFELSGTAASFNVNSQNLGGFVERIAPTAFDKSLQEGDDVKATFNHDPSKILGRTKSGTLILSKDGRGLNFRCVLDPNNSEHKNIYASVKRKDISECSFAFIAPGDGSGERWADGAVDDKGTPCKLRTLTNVALKDVAVVTDPAYKAADATSVSARNFAAGILLPRRTKSLAELQGTTDEVLAAASLRAARSALNVAGRRIAADKDRDLKARAERCRKIIEADAELQKQENELRARMENAAGIVFGRRSVADKNLGYPYESASELEGEEGADGEFNALQSEMNDVLPGHKLLGYSSSQGKAFSRHMDSGTKWATDYTKNEAGQISLGRTTLGGLPIGFSAGNGDL